MASTLHTATDNLRTALRSINGAGGGYVHTLSTSADQVHIGATEVPPLLPAVYIAGCTEKSDHAHALGQYNREITWTLYGFCGVNSVTHGDLFGATADLLDDIMRCLETSTNRTLSGTVLDLLVEGDADATALSMDGQPIGLVIVRIVAYYKKTTGV
jgi:hypothetical protein